MPAANKNDPPAANRIVRERTILLNFQKLVFSPLRILCQQRHSHRAAIPCFWQLRALDGASSAASGGGIDGLVLPH